MKIAMTGTSGNMGREALAQTMELPGVVCRVLLSPKKKNNKLSKQLKKKYGERIEIVRGTLADEKACRELVQGADYVVHMAAVIPPRSDADPAASEECNLYGAVSLVDAVSKCSPQPKYIHISTVALYGNRNEKHPFGRVGDPLLVSPFDHYAMHKLYGERYCLDAGLDCWAVLRQTAMLHPNMMHDNISDGLMFHTALNAPLEWVSSRDSGYLIKRILERDMAGEVPSFWKKIYNIGAGFKGMETGYDTFNDGFAIIGGSAEKFFKPKYLAARNFHGLWFYDGGELEELFHYQRDDVHEYWKWIGSQHKLYKLGKCVPRWLIDLFLFRRLRNHPNSPYRWVKRGDLPRVTATFGSMEEALALPSEWEGVKLIAKGDFGDYDEMRKIENAVLLDHGYDESKPQEEWDISDMRQAASFRGGEVVSETMKKGDAYKKLVWKCCEGHEFEASPYTVLRGGHWCPACCQPTPWMFDSLAKKMPFYAQVWYDSHSEDEDYVYDLDEDGKAVIRSEERQ